MRDLDPTKPLPLTIGNAFFCLASLRLLLLAIAEFRDHCWVYRNASASERKEGQLSQSLVRCCAMRLANSAGEAMARDSGITRALTAMSPQIATE
jgi:hypothetical protein